MNTANPGAGRIAAIDYGTVRLGIAISDVTQSIASPLENYTRRDPQQDGRHLKQLAVDEEIVFFVVGLPVHLDGRESPKSREAKRFGAWLCEQTGVPVEFHDERFTSVEAENTMLATNMSRHQRKQRRDMLAAQLLLSAYLDADDENRGRDPLTL